MIKGTFIPQALEYPEWLKQNEDYKKIWERPVWVETTTYVGVIGGSGFDYLAYTAWVRNKQWGRSDLPAATERDLEEMAANPSHLARQWVRAPLLDCAFSFILIFLFSMVFVASGTIHLGPNEKVPEEANLLNLQSEFLTNLHPWLMPLYMAGAFLTMFGTLYGTLEIGLATWREMARSFNVKMALEKDRLIKIAAIIWHAVMAYSLVVWMFLYQWKGGEGRPSILVTIITPANFFTGVFFCGLLCFLIPWMDRKFFPRSLRMSRWLYGLNFISAIIFLVLGIKAFWDSGSRWIAIGSIVSVAFISFIAAWGISINARKKSEV